MKPTLFATIGLPASGKSTWARKMAKLTNSPEICKDDIRLSLHGGVWSKKNEAEVVAYQDQFINLALSGGKDVYVHDTNFNQKDRLNKLAAAADANIVWVDFTNVSIEECIRRDSLRSGKAQVGKDVIYRIAKQAGMMV